MTIELNIAGETITFLPSRCAFWHRKKTLILSDVHWGKSEMLQGAGIPMPSSILATELEILETLITETGAEHLLILGDLMHAAHLFSDRLTAEVAAWRNRSAVSSLVITLIKGNHDRFTRLPPSWRVLELERSLHDGPFDFTHIPNRRGSPARVQWSGHIHPVIELRSRRDFLRTPCFVISKDSILMPAFGLTTGGFSVKKNLGDRILAIAGDRVLEV